MIFRIRDISLIEKDLGTSILKIEEAIQNGTVSISKIASYLHDAANRQGLDGYTVEELEELSLEEILTCFTRAIMGKKKTEES